ncbi:Peptidoglycan/LPS O-acetylase OafA/YrhL, contains acyltransferase and SGNH-hydrolase domains [Mucilaginibacter pineti]|uniref:Peptidoglycan/LPS O-acetylase OafA/YrhL, contains acyltransferase and SGNH-hydrolase domains n=1 Tax=Mucilaginibacter pineti TaxID=1391627 RepID=A0A1G6ZLV5_9SPHI|nr:acyltransferase [Mucilaginibacter pineti]SDE03403.1 Peptidoglycan/LPS O-acetylase OafA/YrhL, contains acyltransferase and SGNH-hydrolase domains [Mucilaginibacter pineti]
MARLIQVIILILLVHHLKKIDLLRGIAIILVFLFHCHLILFGANGSGISDMNYAAPGFSLKMILINFSPTALGWTGVPLFFIISGFLIHLGFLKNNESFNSLTFFSKRFWRIYITYWFSLCVFIIARHFLVKNAGKVDLTDLLLHTLTLHNLSDRYFYSINPAYWSLAVEVQLYLIYPLFLYIRKIIGIKKSFMLITGGSILLVALGILFADFNTLYIYSKNTLLLWYVWVAGAYYAEVIFLPGKQLISKNSILYFLIAFFMLTLSVGFHFTAHFSFYLATLAWIIFFDWILYAKSINVNNILSKFLISTGLCSYSFYLIHQPFLEQLLGVFGLWSGSRLHILSIVPAFLSILFISYILYATIEKSSIRLGYKLRKRRFSEPKE